MSFDQMNEVAEIAYRARGGESRRDLLSHWGPDRFATTREYVRFLGVVINRLSGENVFEKSALTFEPYNALSESEAAEVLASSCPPKVSGDDLNGLGIVPVDVDLLKNYFLRTNAWDRQCFDHLHGQGYVLCDPYYCSVLFNDGSHWRQPSVALDGLEKKKQLLPPELIADLLQNPSKILNEGAELASFYLREIFDGPTLKNASEGEVPELVVHDAQELDDICGAIRGLTRNASKIKLWYRGQNQEHLMADGQAMVKKGYFLHRDLRDAALIPAAYRGISSTYGDANKFKDFVFDVMQWYDCLSSLPFNMADNSWAAEDASLTAALECYGFPTQSIALTSSFQIAFWFATHQETTQLQSGSFKSYQWASLPKKEWPCIYVFLLVDEAHPIIDVASLPAAPLRAVRQQAGALSNGGMLLRNGSARYLSLKLRLHPSVGTCNMFASDDLFPAEAEDETLRELLARNVNLTSVAIHK